MTESGNSWKTPHDYEVPVAAAGSTKLPLKNGVWNQITLHLMNNKLDIRLNDTQIFDQPIDRLPQGLVFGFFHYADKTHARIRNIQLTASWPDALPDNLFALHAD